MQGRLPAFFLCWSTYWPLPSISQPPLLSFPLFVTYALMYSSLLLCVSGAAVPVIRPEPGEDIPYFDCSCSVPPSSSSSRVASIPLLYMFVLLLSEKAARSESGWWMSALYPCMCLSVENIMIRMGLNVLLKEKRWRVVTTMRRWRAAGP